ncbi:hypothetical protein CGRA01v4_03337 [Colletotrichum graminicola]|nr:hypothetical protein CGRA01v4_03337 [Colletotrichum graminicola]
MKVSQLLSAAGLVASTQAWGTDVHTFYTTVVTTAYETYCPVIAHNFRPPKRHLYGHHGNHSYHHELPLHHHYRQATPAHPDCDGPPSAVMEQHLSASAAGLGHRRAPPDGMEHHRHTPASHRDHDPAA